MIVKHKIMRVNNEEVLIVFLDRNLEEFADELGESPEEREHSLKSMISEYIKKKKLNFTGSIVKIVVGSLLVATLTLGAQKTLNAEAKVTDENMVHVVKAGESLWTISQKTGIPINDLKTINNITSDIIHPGQELLLKPNTEIGTYIVQSGDSLWKIADKYSMSVNDLKELNNIGDTIYPGQKLKVLQAKTNKYTVKSGDSLYKIANQYNTTIDAIKKLNNLTSDIIHPGDVLLIPTTTQTTPTTPANPKPETTARTVTIKRSNGSLQTLDLEEYVVGVVSAELGAGFHEEAYKAQAVAARTYAAKMIELGQTLTDTDSHQVYRDKTQIKNSWGERDFNKYYPIIQKAVNDTRGEVITYNGKYIEAYFFSTSNGKTEEPKYVWGGTVPYLKSVDSHWDTRSPYYYKASTFTYSEFANRLGISPNSLYATVTSRTANGSVNTINIGGRVFTGTYVKSRLGLRSTDFTISFSNGKVTIEQRGWGHGVGLSQYGAHFMAQEGYTYDQIIRHYYQGVKIEKM